ncbi:MAG: SDR family oxidoreductase, partial [Candidatus Dormibacteraeota bacterium]|nr:SDR family oxidoreductase [Candidatus Dormibacteraeota bacterium]
MDKDIFRLDDKVAVITGGSRGIGRSIAEEFARRGARVVISARKQEELDETAAAISAEGGVVTAIAAHAAREETIDALVDQVMEKHGRIDILVNNAATNVAFAQLSDLEVAAWDKTIETNLRGPFILSKKVVNRWMKEHGGNIINMCSIAGFRGDPNMGAYSVSKAALVMLTKVQARELGAYGIRVNGIAPAVIKTRFSKVLYETEEIRKHAESQAALGRVGEWNEVAGTAVYLASDASTYVTGSIALVDGGTLA